MKRDTMTITEHLVELRKRIIISFAALAVGTVVGYIWYGSAPFGTMPLGELLRGPYCSLPPELRADFTGQGDECRLIATKPFEMFLLRLKVGLLAGIVLASPVWLSQIWGFVAPGLYKNEKRFSAVFITLAVLLFVAGATMAYFLLDFGLAFLLGIGQEFQIAALTGEEYFKLVRDFMVIFGVCFEVPLFIVALNMAGILRYEHIEGKRSIITIVVLVFGAMMSPGGDIFSMMALSASVGLLIEMSFQFCRINDKRRNRERPEWLDLDDDESSGPIAAPAAIGEGGGIDAPAPISAPTSVTSSSRPTRNSRPPRPTPVAPTPTEDLRTRPLSDFDDVL